MILGPGNIEVKCLVHNPANVRILTTSIDAFIDKGFKAIAYFYLPNLPNGDINATLSTVGNYLANRVILTNPESPDDNNMYEASMTIINVTCEDETQYQCNVLFEGDNVLSNDTTFVLKGIEYHDDQYEQIYCQIRYFIINEIVIILMTKGSNTVFDKKKNGKATHHLRLT